MLASRIIKNGPKLLHKLASKFSAKLNPRMVHDSCNVHDFTSNEDSEILSSQIHSSQRFLEDRPLNRQIWAPND